MPMPIDIRKQILAELQRQHRSHYWLAGEAAKRGASKTSVYAFLAGKRALQHPQLEIVLECMGFDVGPRETKR